MMTERQRRFREQYVANIASWYNGLVHVAVTYGVGAIAPAKGRRCTLVVVGRAR